MFNRLVGLNTKGQFNNWLYDSQQNLEQSFVLEKYP